MTLERTFDFHDGSHYQGDAGVNITELHNGSTKLGGQGPAVCWKATQSTAYVDPTFQGMRTQFNAQGFSDIFCYHWLSSTADPVAQADHYLRTMGVWRKPERHMIDAEEAGVTVDKVVKHAERVEATTKRPSSVYTGLYVAGGTIWKDPAVRTSKYGPRPMHLAAYVTVTNLIARLKALGILDLPIHFWQYSSDGPVPGVKGRADMNHVCDWAMINNASNPPQPIPEGEEMPQVQLIQDTRSVWATDWTEARKVSQATIDTLKLLKQCVLNADGTPLIVLVADGIVDEILDKTSNRYPAVTIPSVPPVKPGPSKLSATFSLSSVPGQATIIGSVIPE